MSRRQLLDCLHNVWASPASGCFIPVCRGFSSNWVKLLLMNLVKSRIVFGTTQICLISKSVHVFSDKKKNHNFCFVILLHSDHSPGSESLMADSMEGTVACLTDFGMHKFTRAPEGLRGDGDSNKPQRDHQRVGRSRKTHWGPWRKGPLDVLGAVEAPLRNLHCTHFNLLVSGLIPAVRWLY